MKKLGILLCALRCLSAQSACDLNNDGVVNVLDVQLAINQYLGVTACTNANLLGDGCTQADVQDVINTALGGTCVTDIVTTPPPPGDSLVLYESDGVSRTALPITFGRAFAQGEFPQCLQPQIGGSPIASYQVDVKNRWPDGSLKFAVVSLVVPTLPALGSAAVTFQAASSCNNTGYLTQSQMIAFNSGSWGAQMRVSAQNVNGTNGKTETVTVDAKSMLGHTDPGSNAFGDGRNDYWLQGPVVTAVIVQDATPSTAYDFGWVWDGAVMRDNGSSSYAANCGGTPNCAASLHPWFILYFYPSCNCVRADMILEDDWTDRGQNQAINVDYYAGSTPTKVWGYDGVPRILPSGDLTLTLNSDVITSAGGANFTAADVGSSIAVGPNAPLTGVTYDDTTICSVQSATQATLCGPTFAGGTGTAAINLWYWGQMYRKTFWTGASGNPGNFLIDHNWPYIVSTGMVPPYDTNRSASPDSEVLTRSDNCNFTTGTDFTCMAQVNVQNSGFNQTWSDMGDRGGHGRLDQDFSQYDNDPTPMSREALLYLTNMGTCGAADGACAKAWLMLTGQWGARDASIAADIAALNTGAAHGGAGIFNNSGNIPFHLRESRVISPSGSGGHYFCPNLAAGQYANTSANGGNNVLSDSTICGSSSDTPFGRPFSKYYDPNGSTQAAAGAPSGAQNPYNKSGAWNPMAIRWLEWTYAAYLITGDYYYALDTQMNGAWSAGAVSNGTAAYNSNGSFAFMNSIQGALRQPAGLLDAVLKAHTVSPDGSLEQEYFDSILASNAEVYEGMLGLTGTPLTPTSPPPNVTGAGYNINSSTRWDWGRLTVVSLCGAGQPQGASCNPIAPALHYLGVGQNLTALNANGYHRSFTVGYAIPGATTQILDWQGGDSVPAVGTIVYISNAQSPWTAMNGNHTVLAAGTSTSNCPIGTCQIYTIDANTTGNTAGSPPGSIMAFWGAFGQITNATVGSNSTLTTVTVDLAGYGLGGNYGQYAIYGCVDQAGGVTPNWSLLNGLKVLLIGAAANQVTISGGFNSSGFPAFSQSGCFISELGLREDQATDMVQGWMEGLLGVTINEMAGQGVTYFQNVATQMNYRLIEKLQDPNYNPYLVGLNVQPIKSPAGGWNIDFTSSPNPFLSTWGAAANALAPNTMQANSFWGQNAWDASTNPCTDHGYALVNRAQAAFLPGLTDTSDGNLSGTAAWNWININLPYFNYSPPNGDPSCAAASSALVDTQIKFAFAPR